MRSRYVDQSLTKSMSSPTMSLLEGLDPQELRRSMSPTRERIRGTMKRISSRSRRKSCSEHILIGDYEVTKTVAETNDMRTVALGDTNNDDDGSVRRNEARRLVKMRQRFRSQMKKPVVKEDVESSSCDATEADSPRRDYDDCGAVKVRKIEDEADFEGVELDLSHLPKSERTSPFLKLRRSLSWNSLRRKRSDSEASVSSAGSRNDTSSVGSNLSSKMKRRSCRRTSSPSRTHNETCETCEREEQKAAKVDIGNGRVGSFRKVKLKTSEDANYGYADSFFNDDNSVEEDDGESLDFEHEKFDSCLRQSSTIDALVDPYVEACDDLTFFFRLLLKEAADEMPFKSIANEGDGDAKSI